MSNIRPFIFVSFLLIIVMFLTGFRLGRRVERIDKAYVSPTQSITPLLSPSTVPFQLATYISSGCAVSFLYPSGFKEMAIASDEASLAQSAQKISLICRPERVKKIQAELVEQKPTATRSKGVLKIKIYTTARGTEQFILFNPQTGRNVFFEVSPQLSDLVLKTVEFGR